MDISNKKSTLETWRGLDSAYPLEMLWHCRSDPRFHYYTYIPGSIRRKHPPAYKLLCFIHGTKRKTEECRRLLADFAASNDMIVICPVFPGGLLDLDDTDSYKLLSWRGVRYDLALLSMIDEMRERYPLNAEKFFLCGWSGGGPFVNRFLYVHPERLEAVCFGAPGHPTYLDDSRDYCLGTRDFEKYFNKRPDVVRIRQVAIMMMVGENDRDFLEESSYGNNRCDRIKALQENLNNFGIEAPLYVIDEAEREENDREKVRIVMKFFQSILDTQASGSGMLALPEKSEED